MSEPLTLPSQRIVESRLRNAIARFRVKDRHLLRVDANERSVSHRLALHLQRQFDKWHVDCEYNRVGDAVKSLFSVAVDNRVDWLFLLNSDAKRCVHDIAASVS